MSWISTVVNFVFPKFCLYCDTSDTFLCKTCKDKLFTFYKFQHCHVCHQIVEVGYVHEECKYETKLDGVFVVVDYNEAAKELLYEIKFNLYFAYAEVIAEMMKAKFTNISEKIDVAVPVPLHRKKKWYRGFNQAELISRKLPCEVKSILIRKVNTATQVGLGREQRLTNLTNAFEIITSVDGKSCLLVDDVTTSGSTLEECALVLKEEGAKRVYALVWAHELNFSSL